jgi:hypothetical protein
MSFKLLFAIMFSFLPSSAMSVFPEGAFYFRYSDSAQKNFEVELLNSVKTDTKEGLFPNLLGRITETLSSENLQLQGYEEFFKSCVQALVEFSSNPDIEARGDLEIGTMRASFGYNPNEDSKSFSIEQPDITGNRAWVKFYTYCEEEED